MQKCYFDSKITSIECFVYKLDNTPKMSIPFVNAIYFISGHNREFQNIISFCCIIVHKKS